MEQLATQTLSSYFNWINTGVINTLSLNHNEVKCLDMALQFLHKQLNQAKKHFYFTELRDYRLNYISRWLHNPRLKSQLRFDGQNSADWAVMDREDVEWLALALEVGINEDTIITMAADEANYECDMAAMYGDASDFNSHYIAFYRYYCQIAELRHPLLMKLRHILNDDNTI